MTKLSIIVLGISLSVSAIAQEVPAYLKDGVITVTLKSGKVYTYSANEYTVVKRGAKRVELADKGEVKAEKSAPAAEVQAKRHKHIISGEVVSSNSGNDTSKSDTTLTVKEKREVGVGVMYQNNIYKDLYLGGRVDTNGGAGVNIGVGF